MAQITMARFWAECEIDKDLLPQAEKFASVARSMAKYAVEMQGLSEKIWKESSSLRETNAMLAENLTRTERLLAIALKENKALWDGIEAIREKQLEKPRCPVCNRTLIDGDWCDNHGRINERLNQNDYR